MAVLYCMLYAVLYGVVYGVIDYGPHSYCA
jgi:hypothetical protein